MNKAINSKDAINTDGAIDSNEAVDSNQLEENDQFEQRHLLEKCLQLSDRQTDADKQQTDSFRGRSKPSLRSECHLAWWS